MNKSGQYLDLKRVKYLGVTTIKSVAPIFSKVILFQSESIVISYRVVNNGT